MTDMELARNYILDRLSDEDRDECERRFLFDPEFETAMLEQERALLDDYVHLRLSSEDADAVLHRVAQEPGHLYRLRIAEGLKLAAAAQAEEPEQAFGANWRTLFAPRNSAWFGGVAAVAVLAMVAAVSISLRHRTAPAQPNRPFIAASAPANPATPNRDGEQTKPQAATPPQQPQSASTSVATFVLLANEERGEGDGTEIALKPGIEVLRLQLTTEEGLNPGHYSIRVHDSREAEIFSAADLITHTESGRRYVDLRIPTGRLASGAYTIDLTANSTGASPLSFRFVLAASATAR